MRISQLLHKPVAIICIVSLFIFLVSLLLGFLLPSPWNWIIPLFFTTLTGSVGFLADVLGIRSAFLSRLQESQELFKQEVQIWQNTQDVLIDLNGLKRFHYYCMKRELNGKELAFMLDAALYHGFEFVYWGKRNVANEEAIPVYDKAIAGSWYRVLWRAALLLENLESEVIVQTIAQIHQSHSNDKQVLSVLEKIESKGVRSFLEWDKKHNKDKSICDKAEQVLTRFDQQAQRLARG
jgi:hypothetical protein